MRVTIIVEDGSVSKNGIGYAGLNLGQIPSGVRAVQWYGADGEVEFAPVNSGGTVIVPPNVKITDLAPFQPALDAWQAAHDVATAPPPPLTPQQIVKKFTDAIQKRLDDFARTRNYDGILSACTYATSTVPKFQAEGQYCVQARDATWAAAYGVLAQVELGQRPVPASIADIENELPVLQWPN